MSSNQVFSLSELEGADLLIDACYAGSRKGNAGDEPLTHLLKVSNEGGFRIRGKRDDPLLITLVSSLQDPDWPDELDLSTGTFTYYGDNKEPGRKLDQTKRYGNNLLELIFESLHSGQRERIPPILVFTKAGNYRDKIFRGLVVPGTIGSTHNDDLISVWHTSEGQRFQNYRATFTILDISKIPRAWLSDIINHSIRGIDSKHAPKEWIDWTKSGRFKPLISKRTQPIRSKAEQLPSSASEFRMLQTLHSYFQADPYAFEVCAAHLVRQCLPDTVELDLTRRYRDGGRDGIGKLRIGRPESSVLVDYAIEAKCYQPEISVGVSKVSRLISRLRHRQFGVLITTSWVNSQAYKEIVEDGHPVMILSGRDIVELLKEAGLQSATELTKWLKTSFPIEQA
ncbi:restriction endonuclease [Pseudomonas sp. B21-036]|uniref:restriction endonuclease n=1 Tax=unclassified Pseudomonas TaxID=196821 RepID=UPI00215FE8E8|nr:restriction endonuclease [Pseudomonas sp. B21-036]UVL50905.1 restriction endonuclease [Pseudomonas sp. B21-036]